MPKTKMTCQHEDVKKEYTDDGERYICYVCGKTFKDWQEVLQKRKEKDK